MHPFQCLRRLVLPCTTRGVHELPQLSKDVYNIERGKFSRVQEEDLQFFRSVLGVSRVLTNPEDVLPHNVDWLKMVRGYSPVVLKPVSSHEVSAILKHCSQRRLAVCPQGGNTGQVGGSVPVHDEIVISTANMNKIIGLDETSGVVTVEAGVILEALDKHLNERGLLMPLDLGAKGSCHIGGNIATNAGGFRVVRYGSLHGSVLGVEVVLPDGQIMDLLSTLRKDNTGYHLQHLFIGSEGTLGVVTKVSIKCPPAPKSVCVAFLGLDSFADVLKTFVHARSDLSEILSSCEMLDGQAADMTLRFLGTASPVAKPYAFYMLIETNGSFGNHDIEKLEKFLAKMMELGLVKDATYTCDSIKRNKIWALRERVDEGPMREGYVFMYDISLPMANYYQLVEVMRERLKGTEATAVTGYGHLGDGNLHLNVCCKAFSLKLLGEIEPFIFEWTHRLRGSVSAEHGIGFKKTHFLHFSKPPEAIALMKNIKYLLDPQGIMNPYKVLPD